MKTGLQGFATVSLAYILAHGITAFLITPVQQLLLPDITAFASLVYLPHGVRVLSTWLFGRAAVLPLALGAFVSEVLFTPVDISNATDPLIVTSVAVGACAAFAAFELIRLTGRSLYAGNAPRVHWRWLLLAGILASVLNSLGQSAVFSAVILTGHALAVMATYAIGDSVGLVITTLVLMMVFRWMRLGRPAA